jgi:two-component system chemotaxis response regulator CheY
VLWKKDFNTDGKGEKTFDFLFPVAELPPPAPGQRDKTLRSVNIQVAASGDRAALEKTRSNNARELAIHLLEKKRKVLIVEDSGATRELLRAAVETLELVEVHTAVSGFDALKVLPRHRFELIITDINMPDINGLELINFVKKNPHYKDTPLFVVTTEGRDQDRERGMSLGANEYVVKPFSPERICELVRRYLKL